MNTSRLASSVAPSKWEVTIAEKADPVARYWQAMQDFSAGGVTEECYIEALDALRQWTPHTSRDFMRKFAVSFADGGTPNEAWRGELLREAQVLLARAPQVNEGKFGAILDRLEHLDGCLAHVISLAADQISDIVASDGSPIMLADIAKSCSATIILAMEFREQCAAEVDKIRAALEPVALAA